MADPAARLTQVADAVAERLRLSLPEGDGGTVLRVWQFRAPDPERGYQSLPGRTVVVVPIGFKQVLAATRGEDATDYRLGVLVVTPHREAGEVADGWVDAEVALVAARVYGPLQDPRVSGVLLPDGTEAVPQDAEVTLASDPETLASGGCFWSEAEFTLRVTE